MKIAIHWFRRDLRLEDNTALSIALSGENTVLPVFIFDTDITEELPRDDARLSFIYKRLEQIDLELRAHDTSLAIFKGDPAQVFEKILENYEVAEVYCNKDYEPYAIKRDKAVSRVLQDKGVRLKSYKDQVIFEENDILKPDGKPYTVFTPYKKRWLNVFSDTNITASAPFRKGNFFKHNIDFPSMEKLGIKESAILFPDPNPDAIPDYDKTRNIPALEGTSRLGPSLRFGTISIRELVLKSISLNETFISELIWREFFMQILYHFPHVVDRNFRSKYDGIQWRNGEAEFSRWRSGTTGFPMVDAGMRQLNATGYMHNRVRMVTAGFLCKHLLIDWRWGEAYFAEKLLDYELSSNNGNWQWAAGTGCDAAPYFRVFNPMEQQKKFDPDLAYIKRWIPEYGTDAYPGPMVDHVHARQRALNVYKQGMSE